MSLIIELPPEQETRLQKEADRAGVTVTQLIYQTLAERFPVEPDENAQSLRLIEQWIAQAPTDPEGLQEAEEDLRTFKQAINRTREEAGARLLYPEAE